MQGVVLKLSVLLLAVIGQVLGGNCWSKREDKIAMQKDLRDTICKGPRDTVIQLPVPEGYDRVYPRATIAKRCSDLTCMRMDQECVATNTTKRILKVEAFNINDGMNKKCTEVEVVEHLSCACKCETTSDDCSMNRVFNEKMCRCDCDIKREKDCESRMEEMPGMVMWDQSTCSCPCNNWSPCGSGEVWAYEKCRCVITNEIDTE